MTKFREILGTFDLEKFTFSLFEHTGIPDGFRYELGVVMFFVPVEAGNVKVDGSVRLISESFLNDPLDKAHVLWNVF